LEELKEKWASNSFYPIVFFILHKNFVFLFEILFLNFILKHHYGF